MYFQETKNHLINLTNYLIIIKKVKIQAQKNNIKLKNHKITFYFLVIKMTLKINIMLIYMNREILNNIYKNKKCLKETLIIIWFIPEFKIVKKNLIKK